MIVYQTIQRFHLIGTITVSDGKWSWQADYAGEVVSVGGYIKTLGSGAGTSTDVQLRNQTQGKDILSTKGSFEVDSATNLLEGAVVDQNNCAFAAGDIIDLDVDAVSTNPADAVIDVVVNKFIDDV